jgi:tetratricopeptide (TPR) repeat protein
MKAPPSPMLARLDAALAASTHPIDAACARAERAGFLARQGFFDQAHADLAILRAEFAQRPSALVTVWICIVEAWIEQNSGRLAASRDKMLRAQALSAAAKLKPLQALSAAWLAHLSFVQDDIEDMAKYLTLAFQLATPDHHAAWARASMVAASAYHFANRLDLAQPWYTRAREHAQAESDDAALGVITFTIAGHRSNHALRTTIFGSIDTDEARRAEAWVAASFNFDQWVGTVYQDAYVQMLRATVYSAQGQHAKALAVYAAHLDDADRQGLANMRATHLADQAWCRFHTGDVAGARRDAEASVALIDPGMNLEDLAVAHGRLEQVWQALGDVDAALHHRQLAREHWARHLEMQRSVIELLDPALARWRA